jgi:hypothetical protein
MSFAEKEKEKPSSPSNKVYITDPSNLPHLGLAKNVVCGEESAVTI